MSKYGLEENGSKIKISIAGINKEVWIDINEIKPYSDLEETAMADDGTCVAWDDAINSWVQIWPRKPEDY